MTRAFLITGATGPVGEATIARLAGRGDKLLLTGRNEERLKELDGRYGSAGRVETFATDVTTPDGPKAAVATAMDRLGGLDGLVHMVGSFHAGPAGKASVHDHEQLLAANFLSAVRMTQAVLPGLESGGHLVFFSTPLTQEPLPGLGGYAASKAALTAWVRSLSHEVKQRGVHANVLMMTMADTADARRDRPHMDFEQAVTPEQVARVVDFLTSDESDALYGAVLPVLGKFGFTTSMTGPPPAATSGRKG